MARQARLKKEVEQLSKEPPPGIVVWPLDETLLSLQAQIIGPEDSPFQKGIFQVSIIIPDRYPFEPPRVRFLHPTIPYHPNIDNEGRICLDTLKSQPQGSWAPSVNINTLLLSIRLLMANPNAEDGLMPDITEEYKRDRRLWQRKAEEATVKCCMSEDVSSSAKIPTMKTSSTSTCTIVKADVLRNDEDDGGSDEEEDSEGEDEIGSDDHDPPEKRMKIGHS